jgi:pyruvate kinase
MDKKSKAKLIWTVTNNGCDKLGVENIAATITQNRLDAVRMSYSSSALPNIIKLRVEITRQLASEDTQHSEGYVPFLLSFIGRRCILSVPGGQLDVADGSEIDISFLVDFNFCASLHPETPTTKNVEIMVSSEDQFNNLKVGSKVTISYGAVELKILDLPTTIKSGMVVRCLVENGGMLLSGVDVHSPDMSRDLFPLLPEDEKTLRSGFSTLADYVIVDGIKSEQELLSIKAGILGENAPFSERHPSIPISKNIHEAEAMLPPRFLLKVDSKRSLDLLSVLMRHIDGVFLSRSELGIDEHPHDLPIIQKELISRCNKLSKTVIVASELMHSMLINANPTRAEVSDMANAAADGADALVLSHEVTEGPNASLVAQVSIDTLINSEAWFEKKWHPFEMSEIPTDDDAVTYGAIRIAQQANVRAIVCFTEGGYTAMKLSSMRTPTDIIAITCNKKIMRQMNLLRSVTAVVLESRSQVERILSETKDILVKNFSFKKGDKFVFVSLTASSVSERNSNLFTVQEID